MSFWGCVFFFIVCNCLFELFVVFFIVLCVRCYLFFVYRGEWRGLAGYCFILGFLANWFLGVFARFFCFGELFGLRFGAGVDIVFCFWRG